MKKMYSVEFYVGDSYFAFLSGEKNKYFSVCLNRLLEY